MNPPVLAAAALRVGNLDGGFANNDPGRGAGPWAFALGWARIGFSFPLGLLLHRLWREGRLRARSTTPPSLLIPVVLLAIAITPKQAWAGLDILMVMAVFPALVVIVADSAPSSDETAAMIRSRYAGIGRVKYVRDERPGLGRAHNAGMSLVTADAVAFTDDDVVADRYWLASIAANFARNQKIGCVTGLIMPAELETRAQWWTEKHGGFGKGFRRREFGNKFAFVEGLSTAVKNLFNWNQKPSFIVRNYLWNSTGSCCNNWRATSHSF